MISLKGGFQTTDRRLDRLPQHDDRNFRFLAVRGIETKVPRSYTWSVDKWLDQGQEGACVGFSFAHDAVARPARWSFVDDSFAREKIYWAAQQLDEWDGGSYPGASPFYDGTSVLAGAKACADYGFFKTYEWAYTVDDLILAVGYKGPAILGIDWLDGMWDTDTEGFIHATGPVAGGHAILTHSVNLKGRYFVLHNSWGQGWGVNGRAKVSFDDMAILLGANGEACIPLHRSRQPTQSFGNRNNLPV